MRLTNPGAPLEGPATSRGFEPSFWPHIRLAVDAVVLIAAAAAAILGASEFSPSWRSRAVAAAYPLLVLVVLHLRGNHPNDRISASLVEALAQILGVISLCAMLVVAAESIIGVSHPVNLALRLWVFSIVYLSIARASLRSIRMRLLRDGTIGTPTLIVGAGVIGEHLTRRLLENPFYGLKPVGLLDSDPLPRKNSELRSGVPLLDGDTALLDAVTLTGAQQVIVAFSSEPDAALVEGLEDCRRRGIEVALVPRMFELVNERSTLDYVGGVPLLSVRPTNPHGLAVRRQAHDRWGRGGDRTGAPLPPVRGDRRRDPALVTRSDLLPPATRGPGRP